jgi:hypothetical protein
MGKISIKKSDLDRIIKEEALKFKKAITLKKELKNIEAQLKQLNECDVNEVEAGQMHKIPSSTGFEGEQAKPKFHNPEKNPNTMMEDEEEITDVDLDTDSDEDVDDGKIDKASVLSAIEDLKMALNLHGEAESEEVEGGEGEEANGEEVGSDDEEYEFDGDSESEGTEGSEEGNEEIDENKKKEVKENLDEPIEGKSVAQHAEQDNVSDDMHKDNHVKEENDTLMESEKKRMAVLAGIIKG